LYYFLGHFSEYFVLDKNREKESAIQKIYDIGIKNQKNYVRMAAFQALFGFIENEAAEK
jgi:aminopeptidase N